MDLPVAASGVRSPSERGAQRLFIWGVGVLVVGPALSWPLQGAANRFGLPGGSIRWTIGAIPDLTALALVAAGLVHALRRRHRPDGLDLAVASFVGVLVAYVAIGRVGSALGRDPFEDGPDGFFAQLLGFRAAVASPLLLVALRSFRWSRAAEERLLDLVLLTGLVLGAGAVLEAAFPDAWEHVGADVLGLVELRRMTYGTITPDGLVVYTGVGGRDLVRAGSFLLEFLQLGFILIPALSVALLRAGRSPQGRNLAAVLVVAAGILASLGRAATACAAVGAALVVATRPPGPERRRLQRLAAAGCVLLVATATATGLVSRLLNTAESGDESTTVHVDSTRLAIEVIRDRPLGLGLGTGLAAATRPHPGTSIVSENAYLDIGVQAGAGAVLLWLVVLKSVSLRLWRVRASGDLPVVAFVGIVALTLGGLVLHTWQMLETTWIVMALAGIALPRSTERR